jgi:hypothetical protein
MLGYFRRIPPLTEVRGTLLDFNESHQKGNRAGYNTQNHNGTEL